MHTWISGSSALETLTTSKTSLTSAVESRQRLDAISAAADKRVHWTNVRIILMFSFCLPANHHCEVYTWQATNLGNDVTTLAIYYNLKSEHIIIHYKRCSADALPEPVYHFYPFSLRSDKNEPLLIVHNFKCNAAFWYMLLFHVK